LSEPAVSYAFEQLEPSEPPPRDGPARLLAEAMAQAEKIRERARAEGYAEGHAEGRAAGHEAGQAEIAAAASALGDALRGVESLRTSTVETVERDAIELALALAGKILAGAIQARPELVVEVVQGALRRISDRRSMTVLVNPADLELVSAAIGERSSGIGQQPHASGRELCDVQGDERVGVGGALVRTPEGEVDASLQTQLERAREVVFTELLADEAPAAEPAAADRTSEIGQPT
jgi:flagellar assembly protein FliH